MIAPDETTFAYVKDKPRAPKGAAWDAALAYWKTLHSDEGAHFDKVVVLDAQKLPPIVSWGSSPEDVVSVQGFVPNPEEITDENKRSSKLRALDYMGLTPGTKITDIALDRVFIGSCTNGRIEDLRAAVGKLRLNDASFSYEMETSAALGFGFRCGFLGLLHLEIIQERLEREFNLDLIATAPSVVYRMNLNDGTLKELHNPADMPDVVKIASIEEPWIRATILTPDDYLGGILKLCQDRRGIQADLSYVGKRAMLTYDLPLNEVVFDFYDRLKSISKGYASFDYHLTDYREGDLVKMSILVNDEPVDALSMLVHRTAAEKRGRQMCEKLKELIPQHLFKIPIQAAIGGRIIARETVSALRKDVTAKCYGGDVSRKRKLLDKQKEGKKRMRQFGKVDIPQEAFIQALKMGD
ncbi:hypothetical protein EN779_14910 [Mesorhizobium sp. M4B.F.Ca.ET.088.02.2.1]|nr:hypothetical protein EN779_14910 [Mesorhizobium sp. M4B.F.Ca.ET.088.02.2.1]